MYFIIFLVFGLVFNTEDEFTESMRLDEVMKILTTLGNPEMNCVFKKKDKNNEWDEFSNIASAKCTGQFCETDFNITIIIDFPEFDEFDDFCECVEYPIDSKEAGELLDYIYNPKRLSGGPCTPTPNNPQCNYEDYMSIFVWVQDLIDYLDQDIEKFYDLGKEKD